MHFFSHYLSKIVHTDELDIDTLAKGTTGFTGADIENMVNQAALRAAVEGCPMVMLPHFEEARDRILMGSLLNTVNSVLRPISRFAVIEILMITLKNSLYCRACEIERALA